MIVRLLLFASAREAAGTGRDEFDLEEGIPLDRFLAQAVARFGEPFAAVLATARVWVNGDEPGAGPATVLAAGDEVAVLPPVSGGAGAHAKWCGSGIGGPGRMDAGRVNFPIGARERRLQWNGSSD